MKGRYATLVEVLGLTSEDPDFAKYATESELRGDEKVNDLELIDIDEPEKPSSVKACVNCGHFTHRNRSGPRQRGWRLKLTLEQAQELAKFHEKTGMSYSKLGKKYGITTGQAYNICTGNYWEAKHSE